MLVWTARGDDGHEKGLVIAAEDLLGVDGAAIVLRSKGLKKVRRAQSICSLEVL